MIRFLLYFVPLNLNALFNITDGHCDIRMFIDRNEHNITIRFPLDYLLHTLTNYLTTCWHLSSIHILSFSMKHQSFRRPSYEIYLGII